MVTGVNISTMTANTIGAATMHAALKDAPTVKSDRRSNKPIMEKRRRARINNCLNELKTLILDATKKDPARHSKLEKADILEKTVKHLQELQRQQAAMKQAADPKIINKFKAGFTECANEVSRFPGLDTVMKRRLLQHLSGCINSVKCDMQQQQRQLATAQAQHLHAQLLPSPPSSPEQEIQQMDVQTQQQQAPITKVSYVLNNGIASGNTQIQYTLNGYFLQNGQQVIPTKLPNGNIALVLPSTQQQQQQQQQQHHHSPAAQQQQQQLIVTMPTRTPSTSSASSQSSSIYERNLSASPTCSLAAYLPPSPANSYEANDYRPTMVIQHTTNNKQMLMMQQQQQQQQQKHHHHHQQQQQQQQQHAQPLALVVRKNIKEEEQPWRPW